MIEQKRQEELDALSTQNYNIKRGAMVGNLVKPIPPSATAKDVVSKQLYAQLESKGHLYN